MSNGSLADYSINLPYGFCNDIPIRAPSNLRFFGRFGIGEHHRNTLQSDLNSNDSTYVLVVSDYTTLLTIPSVFMTKLRTNTFKGRRYITISQEFPAEMGSARIRRNPGFYYRWNDKKVVITKNIATLRPAQIQKQVIQLLKECNRFYLVYCATESEIRSAPIGF